jgi:hypothetical protein
MTWSSPAISDYLYGLRATWFKDKAGKLHITESPVQQHSWKNKTKPSGFFNQPDAEHISAVLFSSSATLSKFNRMAKLAGFGSERVRMIRIGIRQNFDPNASVGTPFAVEVKPGEYTESWAEGIQIFLNPRAINPIPPELFTGCAFHYLRDGERVAMLPDFFVHTSRTLVNVPPD